MTQIKPRRKPRREKNINKKGIMVCKTCGHPDKCHGPRDECIEFGSKCSCFE